MGDEKIRAPARGFRDDTFSGVQCDKNGPNAEIRIAYLKSDIVTFPRNVGRCP
jgi:hypothetical protein